MCPCIVQKIESLAAQKIFQSAVHIIQVSVQSGCNKKVGPERYVSCGSYELLVKNVIEITIFFHFFCDQNQQEKII